MLIGSTKVLSDPQRCCECSVPIFKTGARGPPPKLRCDECTRLKRKRVRQQKDGIARPLGSPITCEACGVKIARSGSNKRFCEDCAHATLKKSQLARYYVRQGRQPPNGVGTKAKCEGCSVAIVKTRADHTFCNRCLRDRLNDYNRRVRATHRRANGVRVRAGVTINCDQCGTEIVTKSINHKYCAKCINQPRIRYFRRRRKTDSAFALNGAMGAAIRKSLAGAKAGRAWEVLVGYTLAELIRHIERQFVDGMCWANRGSWHIDHIIPLSTFSFTSADDAEFRAAWAITNLRPLWGADNLKKSDQRLYLI